MNNNLSRSARGFLTHINPTRSFLFPGQESSTPRIFLSPCLQPAFPAQLFLSFSFAKALEPRLLSHRNAICRMETKHPGTPHAALRPQTKPVPVALQQILAFQTVTVSPAIWPPTEAAAQIKPGKARVARRGVKTVRHRLPGGSVIDQSADMKFTQYGRTRVSGSSTSKTNCSAVATILLIGLTVPATTALKAVMLHFPLIKAV